MKKTFTLIFAVFYAVFMFAQDIYPGQNLQKEKKYYAQNQQYYLKFQNDGNLVMYSKGNIPLWDSKTENRGARAEFQVDGNLVVYNGGGAAIFATNTGGRGSLLIVQNDGNLVVYGNRNNALWASQDNDNRKNGYNTGILYKGRAISKNDKIYSEKGDYYLIFQPDGNLVVYNKTIYSPIWSSNTQGRGSRAVFQDDGNLVVYDNGNTPIFSTNTNAKNSDRLVMQDDGNLVIYNHSNVAVWASK